MFDLGADGAARPHQVAEVPSFQRAAAAAGNGRDIFSGRTPADRKRAAVAHIAVIPPTQSVRCGSGCGPQMDAVMHLDIKRLQCSCSVERRH